MTRIPDYIWLPADALPASFTAAWVNKDDTLYVAVPHWAVIVLWFLLDWTRYEREGRGKVLQLALFEERKVA